MPRESRVQTDGTMLDEIDRIHDAAPERAAQLLREFDSTGLPVPRLGQLAFLFNHVLGEKLGQWNEAAERVSALAARAEAPPGVWRQLFAAQTLRGDALGAAAARIGLARTTGARDSEANIAGELTVLAYVPDPLAHAADVLALAKAANIDQETPLDGALAASFNNVTGRLLDASRTATLGVLERQALQAGAEAARRLWYRAGEWLQHERADYLCAKVDVRIGAAAEAVRAAERGLRLVEANGNDAIERAFLLLPLAAAYAAQGDAARAASVRAEADALAEQFDDELRKAYEQDKQELADAGS
jgi:hypothetical protein